MSRNDYGILSYPGSLKGYSICEVELMKFLIMFFFAVIYTFVTSFFFHPYELEYCILFLPSVSIVLLLIEFIHFLINPYFILKNKK